MRYATSVLCLMLACLVGRASGQEHEQQKKKRAVIVPSDVILAVIAHQPDSPLQFDMAGIVRYLDGEGTEIYRLRNTGSKPIRAYTIAVWTTSGGGDVVGEGRAGGKAELLMPGQTAPQSNEEKDIQFVDLTSELRDKLKLRGPLQTVIVFMVVRVELVDGSTYDDETTLKALQTYFQGIQGNAVTKSTDRP